MLKLLLSLGITTSLLFSCSDAHSYKGSDPKVISYPIENEAFTVVVVQEKTKSYKQTREIAITKAAQIAYDNGYEYFSIIKEDKVKIVLGKTNWPSSYDFPQNLYQEEIVEKGYNRERFVQQEEDYNLHPAVRLKIKLLKNKRSKALKACDYIKC